MGALYELLSGYSKLVYYEEHGESMRITNIFNCVDVNAFDEIILSNESHNCTCILNKQLKYEKVSRKFSYDSLTLTDNSGNIFRFIAKKI